MKTLTITLEIDDRRVGQLENLYELLCLCESINDAGQNPRPLQRLQKIIEMARAMNTKQDDLYPWIRDAVRHEARRLAGTEGSK